MIQHESEQSKRETTVELRNKNARILEMFKREREEMAFIFFYHAV
jgi:hypothetical protein